MDYERRGVIIIKVKPVFEIEQNEYVCSKCNAFLKEYIKKCPKCKT